jgi:hypothetical protein
VTPVGTIQVYDPAVAYTTLPEDELPRLIGFGKLAPPPAAAIRAE